MSNQLLGSKVVVTEKTPVVRSVQSVTTAVLAMVGVTQRGPIGVPRLYTSFTEWVAVNGTATPESLETWLGVQGYFAEGGQFLWFTRTAHYTDITNTATLLATRAAFTLQTQNATAATIEGANTPTWAFADGDTISFSVSGAGAVVGTFNGTAAASETAVGPHALVNGETLTVQLDGGTVQSFTILDGDFADLAGVGATDAELAALVTTGGAAAQTPLAGGAASVSTGLVITSDRLGTSSAVVVGGTATLNGPATPTAATGNVANLAAVTFAEYQTVVGALAGLSVADAGNGVPRHQTDATGGTATLEITASTGVAAALGIAASIGVVASGSDGALIDTLTVEAKDPGAYGNDLTVRITDATSGEAGRFNVVVLQNGLVVPGEVFPNLSMDDTDERYIEAVLAAQSVGSDYITALDLDAGAIDRPANGDYILVGGDNGLTGLTDLDYIGSEVSLTGLRSFDTVPGLTLLAVPGRATAAVHNAMVNYAENQYPQGATFMLALLEPPEAMNAQQIINYWENTAAILGSSQYAAAYWPRIQVDNPNQTLFGASATITSPVSAHIAGIKARTDNSSPEGKFVPAAGSTFGRVTTARGLEPDPDGLAEHQVNNPTIRDLVYPKRINPIAPIDGLLSIDGTKTTSSVGQFPTVPERRTAIFIERSIRNAAQQFRHRNGGRLVLMSMDRTFDQFLTNQMKLDAFASRVPSEAFMIDVSEAINDQGTRLAGLARIRIGIATNKPLDFIWIEFSQHFAVGA